jgi:hypothetical protein
MTNSPDLIHPQSPAGETRFALGDSLVDSYLEFVAGRCDTPYAGRHPYGPNTILVVSADSALESGGRGRRPPLGKPTPVRVR